MADVDALGLSGRHKKVTVITIPAWATGGTSNSKVDGVAQAGVAVAATTAVKIASANSGRKALKVLNRDIGRAEIAYHQTLVPGDGLVLDPAAVSGGQGGSDEDLIPGGGDVYAVSTAGTTLVVVEG